MKCKVCGAESGKYPLCRACNIKKEKGEIIKCTVCNQWHFADSPCTISVATASNDDNYLYNAKRTLISKSEQGFFTAIQASLPEGYHIFPQINLASFIIRTDDARYHNELFRNVDFLVTDAGYCPKMVIEINDQTHLNYDRKERDEKVQKICEEAGIPILKLWTSYGVNPEYIKGRITEILRSLPMARVRHFRQVPVEKQGLDFTVGENISAPAVKKKKVGCYVATCVYGSYDCPEVWVLRRFRDNRLLNSFLGRAFVRGYYSLSPTFVKWFGGQSWFVRGNKVVLDKLVAKLQAKGFSDTPYCDRDWF